jgi:hypothetical protein
MEKATYLAKLNGKYAKRSLILIEEIDLPEDVFKLVRKVILDNFADYAREIKELLSTPVE